MDSEAARRDADEAKTSAGVLQTPIPGVFVRVEDGRRVTVKRVVSDYSKFDFMMPVVTRLVL